MTARNVEIWQRLIESYKGYFSALQDFSSETVDRVALIRDSLRGPDRWVALKMTQYLKAAEHLQLFDSYVCGASTGHSDLQGFRDLILSLPRDWVVERIESEAETHLAGGSVDEYRRFLELYLDLDRGLTVKLARRAAANPEPDIKEAGEDFLQKLGESNV